MLQNKPWKDVIYIHDGYKLEGRVCGAAYNEWCEGKLKETGCGFQIGAAKGMSGFFGLIDDVSRTMYPSSCVLAAIAYSIFGFNISNDRQTDRQTDKGRVARLTHDRWIPVSREFEPHQTPIKRPRCFLEQETLL